MKHPFFFTARLLLIFMSGLIFSLGLASPQEKTGEEFYDQHCQSCHRPGGNGFFRMYPPLTDDTYVGNDSTVVQILTRGLKGAIIVDGKEYEGEMPPFDYLKDAEMAKIVTYIRQKFNESDDSLSTQKVKDLRGISEQN